MLNIGSHFLQSLCNISKYVTKVSSSLLGELHKGLRYLALLFAKNGL